MNGNYNDETLALNIPLKVFFTYANFGVLLITIINNNCLQICPVLNLSHQYQASDLSCIHPVLHPGLVIHSFALRSFAQNPRIKERL